MSRPAPVGGRGDPPLSDVETTQIEVRQAFERRFEQGQLIFDEGEEGAGLYVIRAGQVEISRRGEAGPRVVTRLGPGDFFGEMSVVLGEARTARAVAVEPTALLELDAETLEAMCIEQPEIAIRIIQRLATRLIGCERRLAALGLDDPVGPLVRHLVRQAVADPDEELRLRTSLRELSAACGLSMQEAQLALQLLIDQKLLRLVDDELVAPDREALSNASATFAQGG